MSMKNKVPVPDQEQHTYENAAKAKRIILVDGSGNIIKASQIEENRLGSEMSGSDGATNRVLTLANSSESGNPVAVWAEDQLINPTDYTTSHLSTSSTITFGINIYNTDTIKITYYI